MANQLSDGLIEYSDGTNATVEQMSKDVTTFLMWAAEPHLEARHRMGFKSNNIFNYFNSFSLF